jgi:hypothetical protein
MASYEEALRYARFYGNLTRNLVRLRQTWMQAYGLTEADLVRWAKDRERCSNVWDDRPPPQPNAETCIRGKLASYREARRRS